MLGLPSPPPPFLPCVQTLRFFLQQEGDLRSSSSPPSPLAHPPLFPCAQALRVFLQQEGDLRSSEAWARLQPAKDVIGSIVSSTARFFKDLVSVGCGGYMGGRISGKQPAALEALQLTPPSSPFPLIGRKGRYPHCNGGSTARLRLPKRPRESSSDAGGAQDIAGGWGRVGKKVASGCFPSTLSAHILTLILPHITHTLTYTLTDQQRRAAPAR